ncbi:MAG TPA: PAS domain S-box protein [Chloroflexia bacterium]|nr:PAS domain S-box protein [Chloroflexia bacterium]
MAFERLQRAMDTKHQARHNTRDAGTDAGNLDPGVEQNLQQMLFIADSAPVLIAFIDREQRHTFANRAYAGWLGLAPEEVAGRTVGEVMPLPAYEPVCASVESALAGNAVTTQVSLHAAVNGIKHIRLSCMPHSDERDSVAGVALTITDITESTEVESDLRRKEQDLRDFIENGTVGLHWVGADGTILWANQAELDLLGYTREEYIGHNISEFHADEWIIGDILHRLTSNETLHNYEARLKAKNGSTKHVLISSNVLWDEQGRFAHTRCFTRDITERKKAEEALRESEERHRAVLEQVSEAIFLLDPHTKRFVAANPAFQQLLGYSADELDQMTIYDVLPYDRDRIDRAVHKALVRGDYRVSDRLYCRKDGSLVTVEVGITPVSYAGRKVLCEIVRDITERRRAEEERNQLLLSEQSARTAAEEALKIRDELLAVVSHDLKNPLAAIKGNAQLIRQRVERSNLPDAAKYMSVLGRIDRAQTKMNMLINELMDFGRLQANLPLTLQRRPIDLVALVNQVAAEQGQTTDHHDIQVKTNLPSLVGNWDADRLERAVANLLSNAIKYSPNGGDVIVEVSTEKPSGTSEDAGSGDTWAAVTVKDRGLGIPPDELPHIFEWFRRAHSVSGRISGAGIGLASSLHAVREHGGTIDVESRLGEGSTFVMRLPVGEQPPNS